jgi:geranylgeranyl pyrophosphate synthase
LEEYGNHLGLVFQIVDDLLDIEGNPTTLGKSTGKDAEAGKATFPAVWGVEESRAQAVELTQKAKDSLAPLGEKAALLKELADSMLNRKS